MLPTENKFSVRGRKLYDETIILQKNSNKIGTTKLNSSKSEIQDKLEQILDINLDDNFSIESNKLEDDNYSEIRKSMDLETIDKLIIGTIKDSESKEFKSSEIRSIKVWNNDGLLLMNSSLTDLVNVNNNFNYELDEISNNWSKPMEDQTKFNSSSKSRSPSLTASSYNNNIVRKINGRVVKSEDYNNVARQLKTPIDLPEERIKKAVDWLHKEQQEVLLFIIIQIKFQTPKYRWILRGNPERNIVRP